MALAGSAYRPRLLPFLRARVRGPISGHRVPIGAGHGSEGGRAHYLSLFILGATSAGSADPLQRHGSSDEDVVAAEQDRGTLVGVGRHAAAQRERASSSVVQLGWFLLCLWLSGGRRI